MIKNEWYAGSVSYDTDDLERADSIFHAFELETLVEKMERFMKMRKYKSAEVHFAVHKIGKREIDITEEVKNAMDLRSTNKK